MTPLPQTFRSDGYDFVILKRQGRVVLLEKSKPKRSKKHYEVVIVQRIPEKLFPDGYLCPAHEAMPSPEQWGIQAWSPFDLEAAEAKFAALVAKEESKEASCG